MCIYVRNLIIARYSHHNIIIFKRIVYVFIVVVVCSMICMVIGFSNLTHHNVYVLHGFCGRCDR